MSKVAKVTKIPTCAVCERGAQYDIKTTMGPWGFFCSTHAAQWGHTDPDTGIAPRLGIGWGQKLELDNG